MLKTKSKSKRIMLIKVEPVNFHIKHDDEREAIVKGFQAFLNSLDFPIQIVVLTDRLNLDQYLTRLSRRVGKVIQDSGNPVYNALLKSFKKNFLKITRSKDVVNRSFYIAIPEKENLQVQVKLISERLASIGLKNKVLEDDEVVDVLARYFNDLYQDQKKQEVAMSHVTAENTVLYDISPQYIKNNIDFIQVNQDLNRIISATGYPRTVEAGFLDRIICSHGNFDISVHIAPTPIESTLVDLNKELQKQRADLFTQKSKGILNPSLELQQQDTRSVLELVQKGAERLFNVSLYINCRARTKQELQLLSHKVASELNSALIIPKVPFLRMAQGLKSVLPLCKDELGFKRNVTTTALSAFFPFTSRFLQADEEGIWIGVNKNNIPIIKDIFKLANHNGVILAGSGAGKSYTAKLMISRHLLNGTRVIVIDPQGEYAPITNTFGGQLITISKDSETIINPLDLMGHDFTEKKLALMDLFTVMLDGLSGIQRAVLDKALSDTYALKGIKEDEKTWGREPPVLGDLLEVLKSEYSKIRGMERETYRSIISRLNMYVNGAFSFLNKQTNLNFEKQFVCFNIGEMPKQVKPIIMFLILDYVYMKMRADKQRKLLLIDEAWSLLSRAEEEGYIFEIVKTCRKFGMGLLMITQDVADLVASKAGNALLSNSSYTFLLRQNSSVINSVVQTFRLSGFEKEKLLTARVGEGILICENEHDEVRIIASEEEDKIFTTSLKAVEIKTTQQSQTSEFDVNKGFYRKSDLSEEQLKILLANDYIVGRHVGLEGGPGVPYVLRPRANESAGHFFLVKAIEEYLRMHTDKVETPHSREADVIFEAPDKSKWAFEIETGSVLISQKQKMETKLHSLKTKYGSRWAFVVTDAWKLYKKYKQLGPTYVRTDMPGIIDSIFQSNRVARPISSQKKPEKLASRKRRVSARKLSKNQTTKRKKSSQRCQSPPTNTSTSKKEIKGRNGKR
jgi:hypothetical protein